MGASYLYVEESRNSVCVSIKKEFQGTIWGLFSVQEKWEIHSKSHDRLLSDSCSSHLAFRGIPTEEGFTAFTSDGVKVVSQRLVATNGTFQLGLATASRLAASDRRSGRHEAVRRFEAHADSTAAHTRVRWSAGVRANDWERRGVRRETATAPGGHRIRRHVVYYIDVHLTEIEERRLREESAKRRAHETKVEREYKKRSDRFLSQRFQFFSLFLYDCGDGSACIS